MGAMTLRRLLAIVYVVCASGTTARAQVVSTIPRPLTGDVTTSGTASTIGASKVTSAMIVNGTIVDADVASGAAIGRSKIASGAANALVSDDGSGNLTTTTTAAAINAITTDDDFPMLAGTNVYTGVNDFFGLALFTNRLNWLPATQALANGSGTSISNSVPWRTVSLTGTPGVTLITKTPSIATAGAGAGDIMILSNVDATATDCWVLQDEAILTGSKLKLKSGNLRLFCPSTAPTIFAFDGTYWREVGTDAISAGTSLPAKCRVGDPLFLVTNGADGARVYVCLTDDTWHAIDTPITLPIGTDKFANVMTYPAGATSDYTAATLTEPNSTTAPGTAAAGSLWMDTDAVKPFRQQVFDGATTNVPVPVNQPLTLFGAGVNGAFTLDATDTTTCGQTAHCPTSICASCAFAASTCTCTLAANSYWSTVQGHVGGISKATTILQVDSMTVAAGNKIVTNYAPAVGGPGYSLIIKSRGPVTIAGTIDLSGKGGGGGTAGGSFKATASAGYTGCQGGYGSVGGASGASGNNAGANATHNKIEWGIDQGVPILWGGGGLPDVGAGAQTVCLNELLFTAAEIGHAAIAIMGGSGGGSGGCDGAGKSGTVGTPPNGGGGLFIAAAGSVTGVSPTFNLGAGAGAGSGVSGAGGGSMVIVGPTVAFTGSPTYTVAGSNGTASGTTCGTGGNGGAGIAIACALSNSAAPCTCLNDGAGTCSGY